MGSLPSQVANVYDRPGSFHVRSVCEYGLSGGGVQEVNHDRPGFIEKDF